MITDKKELLAEVVRRYPVLYDRSHHTFKDKNKKKLAWNDCCKKSELSCGKFFFFEKAFLKYN